MVSTNGIVGGSAAGGTWTAACASDSSFNFVFGAGSNSVEYWSDIDGTVDTGTVAATNLWDPTSVREGTEHVTLRIFAGTSTYQWEIFTDATAGVSCHLSIAFEHTDSTITSP